MATIWTSGLARMPPISRIAWVPKPMQASVIFSLGGTNPAPPSTWRGTMAKALAATPRAAMKRRRETDTDGNLLLGAARFREDCFCGWFICLEAYAGGGGRQRSCVQTLLAFDAATTERAKATKSTDCLPGTLRPITG